MRQKDGSIKLPEGYVPEVVSEAGQAPDSSHPEFARGFSVASSLLKKNPKRKL
jgi:hypothetical protein